MKTYAYGFPRLGKQREFKRLIEGYWAGKVTQEELLSESKNSTRRERRPTADL